MTEQENRWISISEKLPEINKTVYFLWTDEYMKDHIESGSWSGRTYEGRPIFDYVFIGALEPTHWVPCPEFIAPPYPE